MKEKYGSTATKFNQVKYKYYKWDTYRIYCEPSTANIQYARYRPLLRIFASIYNKLGLEKNFVVIMEKGRSKRFQLLLNIYLIK